MKKFKCLPFVSIENTSFEEELQDRPLTKIFVDIFDGHLWSSKVSLIGNTLLIFLILVSTVEIFLSTTSALDQFKSLFQMIYFCTSLIFTIEISLRIILSGYLDKRYEGIRGKIRYLFSFYCIIDVVSVVPFLLDIFGFAGSASVNFLRILRAWRLIRYVPALSTITDAFRNKKEEILVSFLGYFCFPSQYRHFFIMLKYQQGITILTV